MSNPLQRFIEGRKANEAARKKLAEEKAPEKPKEKKGKK